jgi:hypothetical protein
MHIRLLYIAAVLVLSVAATEAQELAGTFDQLRVLVKTGDTLTVTDGSGHRIRGKLTELTTSSLVLDVSGAPTPFQDANIRIIEKRGEDPLKNGALIGLGIGAAFGTAAGGALGNSPAAYIVGGLIYGGIGAGIGTGIDALIDGQRIIYAGRSSTGPTVNVAPIVTGRHRGVLVSMRWSR